MKRETKTLSAAEVRFAVDQDAGTFVGYASIFGEADSFGDTIKPGAFRKSLAEHKRQSGAPAFLWNHNPDEPIGTWTDIAEDARGLKVSGRLVTETTRGREAHLLLKAGAVNGLSIGFRTRAAQAGPNGGRVLTDIELVEISLVSLPAASKARVHSVRSAGDAGLAAFTQAVSRAAQSLRR